MRGRSVIRTLVPAQLLVFAPFLHVEYCTVITVFFFFPSWDRGPELPGKRLSSPNAQFVAGKPRGGKTGERQTYLAWLTLRST